MAEEAERQGREVERLRADMLVLAKRHYEKAIDIFQQPLDIANYNMGHAVQMTRLVIEIYKLVREEEQEAQSRDDGWGKCPTNGSTSSSGGWRKRGTGRSTSRTTVPLRNDPERPSSTKTESARQGQNASTSNRPSSSRQFISLLRRSLARSCASCLFTAGCMNSAVHTL